jgi:hypothetical protein
MTLSETLQRHLLLCEQIHQLLLEENRLLQTTRMPPPEDFLQRKRELLPRLDAAKAALTQAKANHGKEVASEASTIDRLQKKMLSLLLLDRENEKLLLKYSVPTDALRTAAKPRTHVVARAYSSGTAS